MFGLQCAFLYNAVKECVIIATHIFKKFSLSTFLSRRLASFGYRFGFV